MSTPMRSELLVSDVVPFGQPVQGSEGRHHFYALSLERPEWNEWRPGQFIMIRPASGSPDLLARPLPVCRVTPGSLVLFFHAADEGARRLASLGSGERVVIWGPLGNGFSIDPGRPALLLAHGEGIASFAGYADMHPDPGSLSMLFGHSHPSGSYPTDAMASRIEMEDMFDRTPEEKAAFHRTALERIRACGEKGGVCLACGPMDFMAWVWRTAVGLGVPAQLALSGRLACGIGACLGCSTRTSSRWPDSECAGLPVRTCTSGPVFWASEIDLSDVAGEERP